MSDLFDFYNTQLEPLVLECHTQQNQNTIIDDRTIKELDDLLSMMQTNLVLISNAPICRMKVENYRKKIVKIKKNNEKIQQGIKLKLLTTTGNNNINNDYVNKDYRRFNSIEEESITTNNTPNTLNTSDEILTNTTNTHQQHILSNKLEASKITMLEIENSSNNIAKELNAHNEKMLNINSNVVNMNSELDFSGSIITRMTSRENRSKLMLSLFSIGMILMFVLVWYTNSSGSSTGNGGSTGSNGNIANFDSNGANSSSFGVGGTKFL